MFIVTQTRSEIINIDNITRITLDGEVIIAYMTDGAKRVLGNYGEERSIAVFSKMAAGGWFSPTDDTNVVLFGNRAYYMPEE